MINHLRHMAVFARVVDEGSFRAAAKTLGLAPSRVSQTVSDLEQYLGVTLLNRTTRKFSLTDEGRRFYTHVADCIKSAEAGLNELNTHAQAPVGSLKISMPAFLASSDITSAIAAFAKQYPKVTLFVTFSDHVADIMSEGLDLSIRAGWLQDSSMMSRKLSENRRFLVAGKTYFSSQTVVKHPSDLVDWQWIGFHMRSNIVDFVSATGEKVSITENSQISVNSAEAALHLTTQNAGLAILPEHLAQSLIANGELVHVLPEWELKSLGYYAVWPDRSRRESLTLLLVRFLAEHVAIKPS